MAALGWLLNLDFAASGTADAVSTRATTGDYLLALQSALQATGYFSEVIIGEPDQ